MKVKRKAEIIVDTVYKNGGTLTEAGQKIWPNQSKAIANVSIQQDLQKPSIKLAVAEQLDAVGLTDEKLDGELLRVVKQNKQLSPKLGAIIEANKMKQRYPKDSITQAHLHLHGVDQGNIDSKIDEILGEIKQLGS